MTTDKKMCKNAWGKVISDLLYIHELSKQFIIEKTTGAIAQWFKLLSYLIRADFNV